MYAVNEVENFDLLQRNIYSRCKDLQSRIAIVGSGGSAKLLLKMLQDKDIEVAGVYDSNADGSGELMGFKIEPLENISELQPKDAIVIASNRDSADLYDTISFINSINNNKIVPFRSLIDIVNFYDELKFPLNFNFGEFLFGQALFPNNIEDSYWHPVPPGIDFSGKTVLELGPWEGHNSIMIMEQNPKKVIGLEIRPLHFAKTATISSLYKWQNYQLVLGDMHFFPTYIDEKIDIIYNSGVLYHSSKPWWLLKTCLDNCETMVLSTYVASEHSPDDRESKKIELESGEYEFEVFPDPSHRDYGLNDQSLWFKEEDLIRFIEYYGFEYIEYKINIVSGTGKWIFSVVKKKK